MVDQILRLMEYEIVHEERIKGAASGTNDIESSPIDAGFIMQVRHVSVENQTSAYTKLVIGVADGMSFHKKMEQGTPSANTVYSSDDWWMVTPGKRLRARLTGCTSGDRIVLWFEGIIYKT